MLASVLLAMKYYIVAIKLQYYTTGQIVGINVQRRIKLATLSVIALLTLFLALYITANIVTEGKSIQ